MLTRLDVRNVVLIDKLSLDFSSGLTVLTGETGAGKSILLDSLGLALGSRANFDLIGRHDDRADVIASFDLPLTHPVMALLEEAGIESDGEIILRRQLREGKSPAHINDMPVSASFLRQVGDALVEIQGQFEGRGLLDISTHRSLLDRFAGTLDAAEALARLWQDWQEKRAALTRMEAELERARADEDWLRDAVAQLDEINPAEDEEDSLNAERRLLANVTRIAEALQTMEMAIAGENGASSMLASALKALDRLDDSAGGMLAPLSGALGRAEVELEESLSALADLKDRLEADPGRLSYIEDRLHALRSQARKHQVTVAELPRLHEDLADRLAGLDDQSGGITALAIAADEAGRAYKNHADALSEARRKAAAELDASVMEELPPLKLEAAEFRTVIDELEESRWGPAGKDQVRFEASTNPGTKTGPIDRIASGGELARFLLALKVVLADLSAPMTLIFDEVDSGVGGAVAAAVGSRLARLGESLQCLVITHSPQVAARGGSHFLIRKRETGTGLISRAEPLDAEQRVEEIGRMLAGKTLTSEARAAALRLLELE
ncbi:DNA repair protein RecN [Alphaproteobacteria bacterium LSUCC0684]